MTIENALFETYIVVLEKAIGHAVTPTQRQHARDLCEGGTVTIVAESDRVLVSVLGAVAATTGTVAEVHLVTDSAEQTKQASMLLALFTLAKPIVCATAETLILEYLKGTVRPLEFAIILDGERTMLRDSNTPVILGKSPTGGATVTTEVLEEADKTLLRGRDYEVQDGKIVVRDPQSGELMPGRRFSEGLHPAIQKREGLPIEKDGEIIAQITFIEYFRRYDKLAVIASSANEQYMDIINQV